MSVAQGLREAFHYLYREELPALQELARSLPPNPVVVNIGAGAGTSGVALLESRPDLLLTTIDITKESSPFGCLEAELIAAEQAGVADRLHQIHGRSQDVADTWKSKVDMVFVDGDHSLEGATGDIVKWIAHLKPGGIIAVHDYNKQLLPPEEDGPHPMPWYEVNRVVDTLLDSFYERVIYVKSLVAYRMPDVTN